MRSINPADYQHVSRPVAAMAKDFKPGSVVAPHLHPRGQLLHAVAGVMEVTAATGLWLVPPMRALWVPPAVEHGLRTIGAVAMRTVYIAPEAARRLPQSCTVIEVSALLRELIKAATVEPVDYAEDSRGEAVARLILHELANPRTIPLHLPWPRDPRLVRLCRRVLDDLADDAGFEVLAEAAGASTRTLARAFQRETGMGFLRWRQQARLVEALSQLSQGLSVSVVAARLGYRSPSAFTAMFRRALGTTPGHYMAGADI
ncbi:AraC family transcriptional regulator [Tistrella bauzanensis]|uniref:AraC family transcriptional regulator n=1 Tax=Tistrella bauzanensis TaxID=657419 RepID=A0ABQ1I9E7_9PROT|nr:helix-turn-helix transcriptional regulator [Tistrella bauzanensis]GGB26531.1 AraC family transcriptional regulator [Tistrella bauzanensis]